MPKWFPVQTQFSDWLIKKWYSKRQSELYNIICNVQERWRQHIKRAIGAETPTNNKLYPAMLKYGVENFTFELIEETTRDKLNEREDYWQDFYKAKEYGYSIK